MNNQIHDVQIRFRGHVRPPPDMLAVARAELNDEHFAALMVVTGGAAPTSRQFLDQLEKQRHDPRD